MKLLLVLYGESYRSGSAQTRFRGIGNYIERQEFASMSHIKLIEEIEKNLKIKVDCFINTYKLNDKDDENLLNLYKNTNVSVIKSNFHENLLGEGGLFINTYDEINEIFSNDDSYDFLFIIRIDLYLKNFFIKNLKFDNNIQFTHLDSNISGIDSLLGKRHIPAAVVSFIYPKAFFFLIKNKIVYNTSHSIYDVVSKHVSENNISFMVKTMHLCTSDYGWNPLYAQVGRKYSLNYNTCYASQPYVDYIYDHSTNIVIKDNDKTINYWNDYIDNEEKKENELIGSILNK